MPIVIEPSWVGRRVSVRRVVETTDDGRVLQGDVVGDLVDLDGARAVVESRGGLVEVPLVLVTIARIVPPSTADELALERVAARGLRPAETAEVGGWSLRADHGFTMRANSVLPLRQLGMPLDDALGRAREWYAARGLPLRFQLPVEARRLLDAELGERGWEPSVETSVLVTRLEHADEDGSQVPVALADAPDDDWLAVYRGGAGLAPTGRDLLTRHDDVAFASVRLDGRVVAVGRGVVDDGWLGVAAVEVDPAHRRQGLAAQVMSVLTGWGVARGALRAYLQVSSDNAPALALYDRLGYWPHHDYRYRTEPS